MYENTFFFTSFQVIRFFTVIGSSTGLVWSVLGGKFGEKMLASPMYRNISSVLL